jgi:pimeloyl-ACP methyl ester carboxylesterase
MPFLNRDGVEIYYEQQGTGDITILLSHGYSATSSMWRDQVETLSHNYSVISWDMRGHGQSASPDDAALYSEAHTIADMLALLDECETEQAVIGGLSLGGYMSLAFNVTHSERVRALMLFDTGPGYKKDEARNGWNKMAGERARTLEQQGLDALGKGNEVRIASHRSAQGLAHAARGMLTQVNDRVIQSLPGIKKPTLVLVGENDETFIIPTDYMALKIPGSKKVVIANAGHASNIDQPAAFNQAVVEFLQLSGC